MIVDRGHLRWFVAVSVIFALSTVLYVVYVQNTPGGPRGGTIPGLLFGIAGSLLMVFAGSLSARKRAPAYRLGPARTWLKGHIWLGLLSVPLILFHCGFRLGGTLERILMVLFAIIIVSGIVGLLLQQQLPRLLKTTVAAETMYEQVPHVCVALRERADASVVKVCGELVPSAEKELGDALVANPGDVDHRRQLNDFYVQKVRPFLSPDVRRGTELLSASKAGLLFSLIRAALPNEPSYHEVTDELERISDERRQLASQQRILHWLHGWLFIHVPLSCALLVFAVAHVVMSLWY